MTVTTVLTLATLGDLTQIRTNPICALPPREAKGSKGGNDVALTTFANAYGSFTLATFVSETVGNSKTQQEIETILSVSRHPGWPRQVQW